MRVYIWGTGSMAEEYLKKNELNMDDIIGFVESKKSRKSFYGKQIYEPHEIAKSEYDYIIVCVTVYGRDIFNTCKELHIDTHRVILLDNWEWSGNSPMKDPFSKPGRKIMENEIDIEKIFPKLNELIKYCDAKRKLTIVVNRNNHDFVEQNAPMLTRQFQKEEYQLDYFRYRTFELAANEIMQQNVKGNVAELGVFKGTFAKLINQKFNDRKLYLFDTFESFDKEEFLQELERGRCSKEFWDIFRDTSAERVVAIMEYPEQCIVKKGLFPATTAGLEKEEYAFVSIDVDFENSILEGLRYFYPRLNEGGAIFIHDFNNAGLEGVREAVYSYQEEIGHSICKIPIADWGGTLIVVK